MLAGSSSSSSTSTLPQYPQSRATDHLEQELLSLIAALPEVYVATAFTPLRNFFEAIPIEVVNWDTLLAKLNSAVLAAIAPLGESGTEDYRFLQATIIKIAALANKPVVVRPQPIRFSEQIASVSRPEPDGAGLQNTLEKLIDEVLSESPINPDGIKLKNHLSFLNEAPLEILNFQKIMAKIIRIYAGASNCEVLEPIFAKVPFEKFDWNEPTTYTQTLFSALLKEVLQHHEVNLEAPIYQALFKIAKNPTTRIDHIRMGQNISLIHWLANQDWPASAFIEALIFARPYSQLGLIQSPRYLLNKDLQIGYDFLITLSKAHDHLIEPQNNTGPALESLLDQTTLLCEQVYLRDVALYSKSSTSFGNRSYPLLKEFLTLHGLKKRADDVSKKMQERGIQEFEAHQREIKAIEYFQEKLETLTKDLSDTAKVLGHQSLAKLKMLTNFLEYAPLHKLNFCAIISIDEWLDEEIVHKPKIILAVLIGIAQNARNFTLLPLVFKKVDPKLLPLEKKITRKVNILNTIINFAALSSDAQIIADHLEPLIAVDPNIWNERIDDKATNSIWWLAFKINSNFLLFNILKKLLLRIPYADLQLDVRETKGRKRTVREVLNQGYGLPLAFDWLVYISELRDILQKQANQATRYASLDDDEPQVQDKKNNERIALLKRNILLVPFQVFNMQDAYEIACGVFLQFGFIEEARITIAKMPIGDVKEKQIAAAITVITYNNKLLSKKAIEDAFGLSLESTDQTLRTYWAWQVVGKAYGDQDELTQQYPIITQMSGDKGTCLDLLGLITSELRSAIPTFEYGYDSDSESPSEPLLYLHKVQRQSIPDKPADSVVSLQPTRGRSAC